MLRILKKKNWEEVLQYREERIVERDWYTCLSIVWQDVQVVEEE